MEHYTKCKDIISDPRFNKIVNCELVIGTKCQNACKYCYRVHKQHEGPIIGMPIDRARLYIDNAIEMGLLEEKTHSFDIFGGDPIVDIDYFKALCKLISPYCKEIHVPTNARLLERIKDQDIDEIVEAADGKVF